MNVFNLSPCYTGANTPSVRPTDRRPVWRIILIFSAFPRHDIVYICLAKKKKKHFPVLNYNRNACPVEWETHLSREVQIDHEETRSARDNGPSWIIGNASNPSRRRNHSGRVSGRFTVRSPERRPRTAVVALLEFQHCPPSDYKLKK